MKEYNKIICIVILSLCCVWLKAEKVTIHVETPGTLSALIGDKQKTVTELVLSGKLNNSDTYCVASMSALTTVDMENVIIVDNQGEPTNRFSAMFKNNATIVSVILPNSITYIAKEAFYCCTNLTTLTIPSSVTFIGAWAFSTCSKWTGEFKLPAGLTDLGYGAFIDCVNLTGELNIPVGLANIEGSAFQGCSGLTGISFSEGLEAIASYAFFECVGVAGSLSFPASLKSIGSQAFKHCLKLEGIEFKSDVEMIDKAFSGCSSLVSVQFPEGFSRIGDNAFAVCSALKKIQLPNSIMEIGSFAFGSCTALEAINIPDKLKVIGESAFDNCTSLASVFTFPEGISEVPSRLFSGCTSLKEVYFPSSVTSVGDLAFSNCKEVEIVDIPSTAQVVRIGEMAFEHCEKLKSINLYDGMNEIAVSAFGYCYSLVDVSLPSQLQLLGVRVFWDCNNIKSEIIIPTGVTEIHDACFLGCESIPSIILHDNIEIIGEQAFYGCSSWTGSIVIPKKVTKIESYTFSGCSQLTQIKLHDGITEIGSSAFSGCGITSVHIPTGLKELQNSVFASCTNLETVALPDGMLSIGEYAFSSTKLQAIELPSSLTSLGKCAFSYCQQLKKIVIPQSVSVIPQQCFEFCNLLSEVSLPEGLLSIEDNAFWACDLIAITIPSTLTNLSGDVFTHNSINAIVWKPNRDIPDETFYPMKYCLVYIPDATVKVPESWETKNIIVAGKADDILIGELDQDQYFTDFIIPEPFITKKISYQREFKAWQTSGLEYSAGWESIVLPFDVTAFSHETKGAIAPFGSSVSDAKPFWLRELTANGYTSVAILEANKPYIISMPNNPEYPDEYNITGVITFKAESENGINIPATPEVLPLGETNNYKLIPTFETVEQGENIYALNTSDYNGIPIGGAFVRNYRRVKPFEAYVISKEAATRAPLMYSIGGEGGEITGLEEILKKEDESLKIYTAGNVLHIDSDCNRNISIYDVAGRMVRVVEVHEGSNTVTGLSSGFYFLEGKKVAIK